MKACINNATLLQFIQYNVLIMSHFFVQDRAIFRFTECIMNQIRLSSSFVDNDGYRAYLFCE